MIAKNQKKLLLNKGFKGFIVTIFRGIFYVKDYNEKKPLVLKYTPDELVAKGFEIKGIKKQV